MLHLRLLLRLPAPAPATGCRAGRSSPGTQAAAGGGKVDIVVPDIGDFDEVAVIELLAQPGDTIAVEQSLITVESDKASMEIPSSHAGVLREAEGQARRQGVERHGDRRDRDGSR